MLCLDRRIKLNRYGLWEGQRSGRPSVLSPEERERLCDILDSGPTAYGIETGIWTSPLVRQVIEEEFGYDYHAGHVRKLLRQLGYSMQRPTTRLVQADLKQQRKWVRYTYPNLKKTPKRRCGSHFRGRGFVSSDADPACHVGQTGQPATDPLAGRAQHAKDLRR